MKFKEIADVYQRIEDVNPKRLLIKDILKEFIQHKYDLNEQEYIKSFLKFTLCKFETNEISTDRHIRSKTDINLAETTLLTYISKFYEKDLESVKNMYKELGDLGSVAAQCLMNTPYLYTKLNPPPLTIEYVMGVIYELKNIQGQNSFARKFHQFKIF